MAPQAPVSSTRTCGCNCCGPVTRCPAAIHYHGPGSTRVRPLCGCFFFFFQAEDGIRDWSVTGVQTCALPISMEAPSSTYDEAIRDEQAKVLRNVRPLNADNMVRGQFRGYRDEAGVSKQSYMATYAALRLYVDSWRWEGVPFYVRAGKSLKMTVTEITVELK